MTPIADLSYRNYDGVIEPPARRWWTIAKMGIRLAMAKKSLYVAAAFSAWYYLIIIIMLFVITQISAGSPASAQVRQTVFGRLIWKDQFLHGFSYSQLILLLVALLIGAGSIANDNRSNALLIYLSKPVTKLDYLIGKWFGIFLPLLAIMVVPTVVFYFYGAMSFRAEKFISSDPWILPKMMLILPLSAMVHASLVLGVSSLFRTGRMAGAAYAGVYFLGYFFTTLMRVAHVASNGQGPAITRDLFYCSIDGLQIGIAKAILDTSGSPPFGAPNTRQIVPIGAPAWWVVIPIAFVVSFLACWVAWRQIRAVQVVG
jgi:ABC-2 type transport system permease protein